MRANIAAKRDAALLRKAAKAAGPLRVMPVDLRCFEAAPSKNAPDTRHPSRKGNASKPSNFLQGPNAWNWPDDQSLSMFDSSHRLAGTAPSPLGGGDGGGSAPMVGSIALGHGTIGTPYSGHGRT